MTKIHQIFISHAEDTESALPDAVATVRQYFPDSEYEYKLWNNEDIRSLILQNFDEKVLHHYDKLKPYAYKSDLARFCILYVFGGWYIDVGLEMISSPPDVAEADMFLIRDFNNGLVDNCLPWQLVTGIMYSKPHNPIFLMAIDRIGINVESLYYGLTALSPTGPDLFGSCVARYGVDQQPRLHYLLGEFQQNANEPRLQFTHNNKPFALFKKNNGRLDAPGTNNYEQMWNNKDIYVED